MSGVVVKTEDFMSGTDNVRLVTYEDTNGVYMRYYSIVKNHKVTYLSPEFYGGDQLNVVRSCDSALDVVRVLLKETGFLTGKVVGA